MLSTNKFFALFLATTTILLVSPTTTFASEPKSGGASAECRLFIEKVDDFEEASVIGVTGVITPQGQHDWLDLQIYAKSSYAEPETVFLMTAVLTAEEGSGIARLRAECDEDYSFYVRQAKVIQPSQKSQSLVLKIGGDIIKSRETHKWLDANVTIQPNQNSEIVFQLKRTNIRAPSEKARK